MLSVRAEDGEGYPVTSGRYCRLIGSLMHVFHMQRTAAGGWRGDALRDRLPRADGSNLIVSYDDRTWSWCYTSLVCYINMDHSR